MASDDKRHRMPAFHGLFQHAHYGVVLLEENGRRIVAVNPKGAELLDAPRREELVGRDLADFLSKDLQELTLFTKAVMNHGVAWTDALSWPGQIGKPVAVQAAASGFAGPQGRFVLLTLSEKPVGAQVAKERKAAQAALDEATYFQDRMRKFQKDVLEMAAHEIRTPLTPMLVQVGLLERSLGALLGDDERKALAVIRRNADRLDKSVQKLFSEIKAS